MNARPDTAKRNASPEHRAAVRAGQHKRWAKQRAADLRASRLTEKRAKLSGSTGKPPATSQAEISARAAVNRAARDAARAAAREAASIAAPMTFTDWKREYRTWAADLRAGGSYTGPD